VDKKIVKLIKNTSIGYLATAASNLQPYMTPVVYIIQNENVYVPLDEKPKTVSISELKRVKNIQENSKVCFLVHHYDEDWTKLWYVMITGYATLENAISETLKAKLKTIHNKFLSKYSQYNRISFGNFYIRIRIDKTAYWNYTQEK
jgi:PPOX class probable F420-dependent enzyme